jgi:L-fuconolactonase
MPAEGRVDAHHHVWPEPEPWMDGPEMEPIRRPYGIGDLEPLAKAAGVTATVLVQTQSSVEQTREFLAVADGSDLVAGVIGWLDLTAPDFGAQLSAVRAEPNGRWLRGLRHQVQDEPDPEWLNRPDVRRGLRALWQPGMLYELLTKPPQLPAALRTVAEIPELPFVLDHCSKPLIAAGELEPWAGQIRELARRPNVTCKLSGIVTEADWASWTVDDLRPYVEVVLEAFGPDRVMFGSDWPVCLLASPYARWVETAEQLTAGLTASERDAVFGGTARRVYAL